MSTTPLQITTDLSKVLERIEQKIDSLQGNVSDLKVGQAKLEKTETNLNKRLDDTNANLNKRLA